MMEKVQGTFPWSWSAPSEPMSAYRSNAQVAALVIGLTQMTSTVDCQRSHCCLRRFSTNCLSYKVVMPSLLSISPSLVYSSISHHEHTHLGSLSYFLFLPCSPCFSAYLAAFSLSDQSSR
ncbi:hypothetical protein BDP55DRAFT_31313 [Colletotrichum godetiae]|uniref:Uncharacterized protein n=1 Tax=Colletotrichum godetiae TaxID=1209918 RepID=A0AAJ0ATS2_9PEZI|nr:uncharacterized protein BDP55DRAFT_31313 [Colletotrichum godetiae]KAK1688816.1 hypothetical protein BDP55DRAFT_31313 [Colletotrichum godetiae]